MKRRIICTLSCIIIVAIVFLFQRETDNTSYWVSDMNYNKAQIFSVSIGLLNPCPKIGAEISGKEVELLFDTGNADGLFITTALKGKVDYSITGSIQAFNADGSFRGDGNSILIKRVKIFEDEYFDVASTLTDWKMYGFFKNNGAIGLGYFKNKVVTLDYKNKKIAVSDTILDYSKLQEDRYSVIPLIRSEAENEKDLLFFEGNVDGERSTIYLDTGSSRSFVNSKNKNTDVEVKLGNKTYEFNRKKLLTDKIEFQDEFNYPLRFALNSDLLKANHFILTIDLIQDNIIISHN